MVAQFIIDSLGADSPTVKRLQEQEAYEGSYQQQQDRLSNTSSYTSITTGGATNTITGKVSTKSADTIALEALQKELAFNRIKTQTTEEDQSKLRVERRKAAIASADLQRRGEALSIEARQSGLGRELASLRRSARQVTAQVLSGAAGAGNIRSSSSQAAQIAARTNLTRETGYSQETEARAKQADKMREEQIAANLSASLLSETDPTKVVQDASGQVFVNGKLEESTKVSGSSTTYTPTPTNTGIYAPAPTKVRTNADNPDWVASIASHKYRSF